MRRLGRQPLRRKVGPIQPIIPKDIVSSLNFLLYIKIYNVTALA